MDQPHSLDADAPIGGPEIDFAILADRAEVHNNKLYMMGGAWDSTFVIDFRQPCYYCLVVGILIPWNEANNSHELTMHIESADAGRITQELHATVTAGRPPMSIKGQSFRAMLTINGQVILPGPGAYVVVLRLTAGPSKRVVFYAKQAPAFPPPFPPGIAR